MHLGMLCPDVYVTRLVLATLTTLWSAHPWMLCLRCINESVEIPIFFTKYMKTVIVDGYRRLKMIYVTQVHSTLRHGPTGRLMASTDHFSDPWRLNLLVTQLFVDDNVFGVTTTKTNKARQYGPLWGEPPQKGSALQKVPLCYDIDLFNYM